MQHQYYVEIWIGESQEYRDSFSDLAAAVAFANEHIGDNWHADFKKLAPCGHFEHWFAAYDKFTEADIPALVAGR